MNPMWVSGFAAGMTVSGFLGLLGFVVGGSSTRARAKAEHDRELGAVRIALAENTKHRQDLAVRLIEADRRIKAARDLLGTSA